MGETKFGIFLWSLPTENKRGIDITTKKKLKAIRTRLWRTIRYEYGCFPYTNGTYIVTDLSKLKELYEVLGEYRKEYEELGYSNVIINLVECELEETELVDILYGISLLVGNRRVRAFEKAEKDGKRVSLSTIQEVENDIKWIWQISDRFFMGVPKVDIERLIGILERRIAYFRDI